MATDAPTELVNRQERRAEMHSTHEESLEYRVKVLIDQVADLERLLDSRTTDLANQGEELAASQAKCERLRAAAGGAENALRWKLLTGCASPEEAGKIILQLRRRIHFAERHNQMFERCESAWCQPGPDDDPAREAASFSKEQI